MADYTNADVVRAKVNKMTNAQLKADLKALLNNDTTSQQMNSILLEKIWEMRKQVADLQGIKQELRDQTRKLDDQQRFLEISDGRERRRNLVITGLPEDADATGTTDEDMVRLVCWVASSVVFVWWGQVVWLSCGR